MDKAWLSTRDLLTEELCAPSINAAYCWLFRKGIIRRGDGKVARIDVQRALKQKSRRGAHLRKTAKERANV